MMNRISSIVLLSCYLLTFTNACSIKEDRSKCPADLILNLSENSSCVSDALYYVRTMDGAGFSGSVADLPVYDRSGSDHDPSFRVMSLPKTNVVLSVLSGDVFSDGGEYHIPYGDACSEIFLYASEISLEGVETYEEKVRLHKDYCRISMKFVSEGPYDDIGLRIGGNVCGYSSDRSCISGPFSVFLELSEKGECSVCVPRQHDNSLVLEVLAEGRKINELALGEYIAETGYDWTEYDLEDIDIHIDYTRTDISLSVEVWENSYEFDIVI